MRVDIICSEFSLPSFMISDDSLVFELSLGFQFLIVLNLFLNQYFIISSQMLNILFLFLNVDANLVGVA